MAALDFDYTDSTSAMEIKTKKQQKNRPREMDNLFMGPMSGVN